MTFLIISAVLAIFLSAMTLLGVGLFGTAFQYMEEM